MPGLSRSERQPTRVPPAMRASLAIAAAVAVTGLAVAVAASSAGSKSAQPLPPASTTSTTVAVPPAATPSVPATPSPSAAEAARGWARALDPIWAATPGGCLTVTAGDRVLYEANPDGPVVPASVTKLLTAVAALDGLGGDTRLRTVVRASAAPANGVVPGDLWLVGGGDPVLGTTAWVAGSDPQPPLVTSLDALADRVIAAGVRRVEGRIVGDDSRYDADRYVDSWPARLIVDGEAGPLSALAVNDGFGVWGHPGVPFTDPPRDAAVLFANLLRARGVEISGPPASGVAPPGVVLAAIDSPTVGELVGAMLRDSDNGTAELLVKELGLRQSGQGSTTAGVRAVDELLRAAGLPVEGSAIADGSGLSDAARLTCRLVSALLAARTGDLQPRLAVAGRNGTLAKRFSTGPVAGRLRAKTGSLDGVAALAGYADNADGSALSFAYVINGLAHGSSGRSLQDNLARALVETATSG